MRLKWTTLCLLTLPMLLAACGEEAASPASELDEGFVDTPDGGVETQDVDQEPDPEPVPEPEQVPVVETFDFAATGPWHQCPTSAFPSEVVKVDAFDKTHQFFGGEDKRTVEFDVDFPEAGSWSQVGLAFVLECPGGVCDHWDRAGSLQVVVNPDDPPEDQVQVELLRHITPYRVGMCNYVDLTPLAGLLEGRKKLRSFIDTWVGPGHAQGHGWLVSAQFVFTPGENAGADEVINIWSRRNITVGEVEPERNVDSQVEPVTFEIPEGATRVEAHLITTGHSFGNTSNCAEFCMMRHDVIVNGTVHSVDPWRGDCAQNPVSPQFGTWEYNRNGWCPGAVALGDIIDITGAVTPGENTLDFGILMANGDEYDNLSPVDLLPYTIVSLKLYVYR